ncbi:MULTISPECIES: TetR/AcrR family transcriptional regulator [unclassified Nocardioides]|uniref:TetR/AcrR family transcriptional regulator n=1 Tax=unclassified Nocardioides TaxID=2615069 RepID=UPI0006F53EFC|nr:MULTISPECIES: TetR/AcrR family transcriptional regulator [unclassified Nocardioides]KQY57111.1 transcriptional regulator [Nocardioides sp. Root140]KQZ68619.1 transcriptional regulator [Nocardioides sp. Root151]KRF11751.1 transcriptional regulator [Nocardioides sp. Soil796]
MRPRTVEDPQLLDLLLEAFADLGYDGTSVRALCRHLGVSHNMIHQRFQSKNAAWHAAVEHAFATLNAAMWDPEPEVDPADPLEAIREVMVRFVDATIAQPALARIIHQEAARPGPRFDHMLTHHIEPVQQRAIDAFAQLQDAGLVRSGPVPAAYFFLSTWGIGGMASSQQLARRVGFPGDDPVESAYLAVDILISGLRASSSSR